MPSRHTLRFAPTVEVHLSFPDTIRVATGPGVHRLTLPLECSTSWLAACGSQYSTPLMLTGHVALDGAATGALALLEPVVVALRPYPTSEYLAFWLADDQLIVLESSRAGADLRLRLHVQATLLAPPTFDGLHPVCDQQLTTSVSAAAWEQILDQAKTEVGVTLRLPSPLTDPTLAAAAAGAVHDVSLTRALMRLREARQQLRDLQWEQAVGTCRKVLEILDQLHLIPARRDLLNVKPDMRDPDQRWAALFREAVNLTQPAHHDDANAVTFTWTRTDSESILALTAALLNHYLTATTAPGRGDPVREPGSEMPPISDAPATPAPPGY